jgi:hypothetical protein
MWENTKAFWSLLEAKRCNILFTCKMSSSVPYPWKAITLYYQGGTIFFNYHYNFLQLNHHYDSWCHSQRYMSKYIFPSS